jgi:hypothetical protein
MPFKTCMMPARKEAVAGPRPAGTDSRGLRSGEQADGNDDLECLAATGMR